MIAGHENIKVLLFSYWLKYSTMALATGALMGFLASRIVFFYHPFISVLFGASVSILICQVSVFNKFWGKRRGDFEYEFKIALIDKNVKKLVLRYQGKISYLRYLSDGMNSISTVQEELCKILLGNDQVKSMNEYLYNIHMKISLLAHKEDRLDAETNSLHSAIEIKPSDFIANYRLAICAELNGVAKDAINYYQKALEDSFIASNEILDFISSQIERVKNEGAMLRPPVLGLRYMLY